MARKPSIRVVMNRAALTQLTLGIADGLQATGDQAIATADPPDRPPFGKGLVKKGAAGTWVNGRKVAGAASKPREARTMRQGATLIVGFGFPGRFQELGVVHHGPQPFLTPALEQAVPGTANNIRPAVRARLGR